MREILFRGKRIDNGAWVEGYYIVSSKGHHSGEHHLIVCNDNINGYSGRDFIKVVPETVGQYTGLSDKNGKKIFEGDIDQHGYICTFTNGAFQMCCFKDEKCIQAIPFWGCDNLMIVGNIHDNSELLK